MVRRLASWLVLLLLLGAALWLEVGPPDGEEIRTASGESVRVIDGDSFRIGDREIRLAGIDAPEYRQTCRDAEGREWPCGKEARAALEKLIGAGDLSCTKQTEDRYGRSLALCRTKSGDVAAELARQGWALGARDKRFKEPIAQMRDAERAKRGIWRGPHEHPAEWRRADRS